MRRRRHLPRRRGLAATLALATAVTAATAAAALAPAGPAAAFGGEDPLHGNPWWHQRISRNALKAVGFKHVKDKDCGTTCAFPHEATETASYKEHDSEAKNEFAAESIAWHADYIDSYLYNPLWWAKGGVPRLKASLSAGPELEKLHFDDLFSADQVHRMYRHYTSGTVAGLIWAAENDDYAAAQNILGVSLHAVQDFYSHSNWVDDPARRGTTYFSTPADAKATLTLFTGAYEEGEHLGIKHHGKIAPLCSLLNQPGVREIMDVLTSGISPLSNTSIAQTYKDCKNGVTVQPYVPKVIDNGQTGFKVPPGVVYLAPAGIALDTTWVAHIGAEQRGVKDVPAQKLFETAVARATDASTQWLRKVDAVMNTAQNGRYKAFWEKVKTANAIDSQRCNQFESFKQMPYTFLSAGTYPPKQTTAGAYKDEEIYLRLRIKTARDSGAGTNADIKLLADGKPVLDKDGRPVVLDYMPGEIPGLAYNDFAGGDDDVYVAGPFKTLPQNITLYNDAADGGEVLSAFARSFGRIVTEKLPDLALTLIAGHADRIGGDKEVWLPEELATVTAAGQPYTINVDGKDEGHYQVLGTIKRVAESPGDGPEDWAEFQVSVNTLVCKRESKWDRGSNSDEPFVMVAFHPLPGGVQSFVTSPFNDVDKGETRSFGVGNVATGTVKPRTFTAHVPKRYGVIVLPVNVMESDDESGSDRQKLLREWVTGISEDEERKKTERGFLAALGTNIASAWKVDGVQVHAWSRGGRTVRYGQVAGSDNQFLPLKKWVDARESLPISLNAAGLKDTGVSVDDLVNGYDGSGAPASPQPAPAPTDPQPGPKPPPPGVPAPRLGDIAGRYRTTIGTTVTVTVEGDYAVGAGVKGDPKAPAPQYAERWHLALQPDGSVEGLWTDSSRTRDDARHQGRASLRFSPDGKSFTGRFIPSVFGVPAVEYNGVRIEDEAPSNGNDGNNGSNGAPGAPNVGGGWITVGKQTPAGFRLRSLEYKTSSVNIGDTTIIPEAGEKLLLVRFTLRNDHSKRFNFEFATARVAAVDASGVVYPMQERIGREGGGESVYTPVEPGGTMDVYAAIVMPAGAEPAKLAVTGDGRDTRQLDVRGKIKPLPAEYGTPDLGVGRARVGEWYEAGRIDLKLEGVQRTPSYLYATISVRNRKSMRLTVDHGVINVTVTDADGAVMPWDQRLYRATSTATVQGIVLEPSGEARFRVRYPVKADEPAPKTLTLRDGRDGRQFTFSLAE